MKIISFYNVKGGTGKTTQSIHAAWGLALLNPKSRILLIDFDGQNSLKTYFRLKMDKLDAFEFVINERKIDECIYPIALKIENNTYTVDVVPASSKMGFFDAKVANTPGRENLLRYRIEEEKLNLKYDFIIIDCPPALTQNSINALVASDFVIIPCIMDDYAIPSIEYIKNNLAILKRNLRIKNPQILGILPTLYDQRQTISKLILTSIQSYFKDDSVLAPIRISSSYKKAQIQRTVVFAAESKEFRATEDNLEFVKQILKRIDEVNVNQQELEQGTI